MAQIKVAVLDDYQQAPKPHFDGLRSAGYEIVTFTDTLLPYNHPDTPENVKDALAEHNNIEIRGFGTFKVRERKSRLARNPRTGDPVEVPPRAVPVFKPSKDLRALVEERPLSV